MSDFDSRARKAADAVRRQIVENPAHHETGIRRARRSPARGRHSERGCRGGAHRCGRGRAASRRRTGGPASGAEGAAFALTGALKPFATCDTRSPVLQGPGSRGPDRTRARRRHGYDRGRRAGEANSEHRPGQRQPSATGAESASTPPEHSKTNVQEAGVDEPDIVKTDGNRIVAVAQARVHLIGSVAAS